MLLPVLVRADGWPDTRTGLIRELSELALTVFRGLGTRGVLEGGNKLVESGPWAGGDTESPLQND